MSLALSSSLARTAAPIVCGYSISSDVAAAPLAVLTRRRHIAVALASLRIRTSCR
jgi:hypothetical protein